MIFADHGEPLIRIAVALTWSGIRRRRRGAYDDTGATYIRKRQ